MGPLAPIADQMRDLAQEGLPAPRTCKVRLWDDDTADVELYHSMGDGERCRSDTTESRGNSCGSIPTVQNGAPKRSRAVKQSTNRSVTRSRSVLSRRLCLPARTGTQPYYPLTFQHRYRPFSTQPQLRVLNRSRVLCGGWTQSHAHAYDGPLGAPHAGQIRSGR